MDKTEMLAADIHKGINGPGRSFFIGRVASIVESALLSDEENISVNRLLKAFADAKKYSNKEQ